MKFTCSKCGKKYGIDNKKLENYGPSFKIKCQSCAHIIVVNNPYSLKKPSMSNKEWYLFLNNQQIGPVSIEEIKTYIDKGELLFSSLVWKQGMPDWKQAQEIEALKHLIKLPIKNQQVAPPAFTPPQEDEHADEPTLTEETASQSSSDSQEEKIKDDSNKLSTSKSTLSFSEEALKEEEDSGSVSPDDFFSKGFEEKKQDKDSRLLRSLTGNATMGNTGIFVMYNQKRKKERYIYAGVLLLVLLIGIPLILHFKNKKPETQTVVKEKVTTEYKDKVRVVEKIKYVTVETNGGRKQGVRSTAKHTETKTEAKTKTPNNSKEVSLYGDRFNTTSTKKLAIKKSQSTANSLTGNYAKDVANVVSTSKRTIHWCYRKELKRTPDLVAKVYFKLNISATGRVNSVKSNFKPSKYNDGTMATCMENKVKLWRFPKNPDSESIDFNFSIALKAN